jgi:hypothetical protein
MHCVDPKHQTTELKNLSVLANQNLNEHNFKPVVRFNKSFKITKCGAFLPSTEGLQSNEVHLLLVRNLTDIECHPVLRTSRYSEGNVMRFMAFPIFT